MMTGVASFFGGMPGANGNPAIGIFYLISTVLLGILGKKSVHWVRPNQLGTMSKRKQLVYEKDGSVKIYRPNVYIRWPFVYHMEPVLISKRTDAIEASGMSFETDTERSQKIIIKAMARWVVDSTGINSYLASSWEVDDIGEYARGTMSFALKCAIAQNPASVINSSDLFMLCEPIAKGLMMKHGAVWLNLLDSDNVLADSAIQSNALHRIAEALDNAIKTLKARRTPE